MKAVDLEWKFRVVFLPEVKTIAAIYLILLNAKTSKSTWS